MGLSIISRDLPRDICGLYDDRHKLILLADWLNQRQRRCTLCHELIHAKHHDPGCGSQYGLKCERRCRRETALALISPVDYGMVEQIYEGNTWMMAVELGVTIQEKKLSVHIPRRETKKGPARTQSDGPQGTNNQHFRFHQNEVPRTV